MAAPHATPLSKETQPGAGPAGCSNIGNMVQQLHVVLQLHVTAADWTPCDQSSSHRHQALQRAQGREVQKLVKRPVLVTDHVRRPTLYKTASFGC